MGEEGYMFNRYLRLLYCYSFVLFLTISCTYNSKKNNANIGAITKIDELTFERYLVEYYSIEDLSKLDSYNIPEFISCEVDYKNVFSQEWFESKNASKYDSVIINEMLEVLKQVSENKKIKNEHIPLSLDKNLLFAGCYQNLKDPSGNIIKQYYRFLILNKEVNQMIKITDIY